MTRKRPTFHTPGHLTRHQARLYGDSTFEFVARVKKRRAKRDRAKVSRRKNRG